MFPEPNPLLSEEEQALLDRAPEECFRRAVERGAFSLEELAADLSPRIALVLQCIASGERLPPLPETEAAPGTLRSPEVQEPPDGPVERAEAGPSSEEQRRSWAQFALQAHPLLLEWLESRLLNSDEAMEAAYTIDDRLGRYPTGTRYAVP